uniref:Secreted protein n=1 Tax=Arundo donax TaxID=35708 RepID=A0A0A9H2T0_ARUDO
MLSIQTLLSCIIFSSCSAKSLVACRVSRVCSSSRLESPLGASTPTKYRNSDWFSSAYLSAKTCLSLVSFTIPGGRLLILVDLTSRV